MYYHESDSMLHECPQYRGEIEVIDNFLSTLEPREQWQLDPDMIANLTHLDKKVVKFIFDYHCKTGLLKRNYCIRCPRTEDMLRIISVEEFERLPFKEFCDVCEKEHTVSKKDVIICYSVARFKKAEENDKSTSQGSIELERMIDTTETKKLVDSMPILAYISNKNTKKPLENKRFIIILHFLKDLIPFMLGCEKLGLNPSETLLVYKEYRYPHKAELIPYFQQKGYIISSLSDIDSALLDYQERCSGDSKGVIIVEDGGYIMPKIHSNANLSELQSCVIGAVEQTTKGERQDKKIEHLSVPILSIAKAQLKNEYEPPHVAKSAVMNVMRLLKDANFHSKKALVIGYGSIGKAIADELKNILRMNVTVFDINPDNLLIARQNGFETEQYLSHCVDNKYLIIGATGNTSIEREALLSMNHETYLVSASSDQHEIGLPELNALSSTMEPITQDNVKIGTKYTIRATKNSINLLADGYPINFWAEESMPNNVSDLIMSLIFISTIYIADNYNALTPQIYSDLINDLAIKNDISKIYLEMHHST